MINFQNPVFNTLDVACKSANASLNDPMLDSYLEVLFFFEGIRILKLR